MKDIFGLQHPFLQPLWRRVLVLLCIFSWSAFELSQGNNIWAGWFILLGSYMLIFWLLDALNRERTRD